MRQVTRYIGVLVLCFSLVLLASCQRIAVRKQEPILYSNVKQHFCNAIDKLLLEEQQLLNLCYKYPILAENVNNNWLWLHKQTLISVNRPLHNEKQLLYSDNSSPVLTSGDLQAVEEQEAYYPLDPTKPIVYLTFDDGPGKYTDQVLDILKAENIHATFFVLGIQVKKNPLFTKRIAEEGHTIGNHTYDHDYKKIYEDFSVFAEQVIETNRIIYELTGLEVTLLRAPGGSINNFDEGYFRAVEEAGFKVFDWNIDSKDSLTRSINKDEIVSNIKESILHDPAIVLLHDTTRHEQSMLALPDIIAYYRELGYQFAPLTEQTEEVTFRLGKNLKWTRKSVTDVQIEQFKNQIGQLYDFK